MDHPQKPATQGTWDDGKQIKSTAY